MPYSLMKTEQCTFDVLFCIFQPTVGIPLGTNCVPVLVDLYLHSCAADFTVDLIQKKEHRLARSFNLSFRYIDDVLSTILV